MLLVVLFSRTPESLLMELILVDDSSTYGWLLEPLRDYVDHYPVIQLIRLQLRQGLIRARMTGARAAKGEVLVFLDAHIEVNVLWLEPLLARILENPKVLAVPNVDLIDWKNMAYVYGKESYQGSFLWDLVFYFKKTTPEFRRNATMISPVPSPIMVGCAHAINRKYFFDTGAYDEGMDIWGGENLEHSFRLWMCGGRVEILPCSRVGHVFKVGKT